jgi:hypothetical protein
MRTAREFYRLLVVLRLLAFAAWQLRDAAPAQGAFESIFMQLVHCEISQAAEL